MFGGHIDLFSFHESVAFCSNEDNFKENEAVIASLF